MSTRLSCFGLALTALLLGSHALASGVLASDQAVPIQPEESRVDGEEQAAEELSGSAELLLFEEFPAVVSAARQSTPGHLAAVPVSSIDSTTIEASGLQTLAELLQFVPGVDVLELDRNRFAVGVHGLHEAFAERTLSMLDGFSADSAIFGGSEFQRLPVFLEDIERIEVVRGPGGAAWGANALTGAINIITLDPEASQGGKVRTTYNEFGDLYTYLRWGDTTGAWSWRLSGGFDEWSSSSEALDESFVSRDFGRRTRANGRAVRSLAGGDRLTVGFGYSTYDQGAFELLGFLPERDGRLINYRSFARLEKRFSEHVEGYVQWLSQFTSTDMPSVQESHSREHHLEMQFNLSGKPRHDLVFGGNVRAARLDTDPKTELDFFFPGSPVDEWRFGFFASDRFRVSDGWTLEAQFRVEEDADTQTDWAGRVSSLWSLDTSSQQVLRLAMARAFRAPAIGLRSAIASRFPIAPGLFGLQVIVPEELENEQSWSLEAGWALSRAGLQIRLDTFYQQFEDLIGYERSQEIIPPFVLIEARANNLDGADAHGASVEVSIDQERQHWTAWYVWNDFDLEDSGQNLRSFFPAEHKAGFRYRRILSRSWQAQALYRYLSETQLDPQDLVAESGPVASSHRLDLTLSKRFDAQGFDLLVGVEDLFDETELAVGGAGNLLRHQTPGQSMFVRFQLNF